MQKCTSFGQGIVTSVVLSLCEHARFSAGIRHIVGISSITSFLQRLHTAEPRRLGSVRGGLILAALEL